MAIRGNLNLQFINAMLVNLRSMILAERETGRVAYDKEKIKRRAAQNHAHLRPTGFKIKLKLLDKYAKKIFTKSVPLLTFK